MKNLQESILKAYKIVCEDTFDNMHPDYDIDTSIFYVTDGNISYNGDKGNSLVIVDKNNQKDIYMFWGNGYDAKFIAKRPFNDDSLGIKNYSVTSESFNKFLVDVGVKFTTEESFAIGIDIQKKIFNPTIVPIDHIDSKILVTLPLEPRQMIGDNSGGYTRIQYGNNMISLDWIINDHDQLRYTIRGTSPEAICKKLIEIVPSIITDMSNEHAMYIGRNLYRAIQEKGSFIADSKTESYKGKLLSENK